MCGGPYRFGSTFFITILPWMFVFGVIYLMLIFFPGWLTPFSNTFGYIGAKAAGVHDLLTQQFLVEPLNIKTHSTAMTQSINYIYGTPSLFINEINSKNFDDMLSKMKGTLFKSKIDEKYVIQLKGIVKMKETIAEAIWYLLFGSYTVMVTNVGIVNAGCNTSAIQMRKRYEDYQLEVKKKKSEEPPQKTYTH